MPRAKNPRARYPQTCKICGHKWLSYSWKGPLQCPWPGCGNSRWRRGPAYLTPNRKAQGWEEGGLRKSRRERLVREREEVGLAELPLNVDPIPAEVLPIVLGEVVGAPRIPVEGVQEPGRASQAPGDEESVEGGSGER